MVARTSEEEQKRRRRKRLLKGLLLGGAAVGLPALANALVARQARHLDAPVWGRSQRYAWRLGEIVFQRLGEGRPPLVLLHSFGPGHDSEEWRSAAEILARRRRVYALDLLGWGRSDKPQVQYDGELYIEQIRDFLSDVVRQRAVLTAAGLSAAYAIQVAADHRELVAGLALVVPQGLEAHGDEPDLKDALVHRLLRTPILGRSALNLFTTRAGLSHHLRREVYAAPEQVDASLVEHHHRSSHQPGTHAPLAAYLCGYLNHRVDEALGRLQVPLWYAWGSQATGSPLESADLWLQHSPPAELEVFKSAGSLPHAEIASQLCSRLERFIASLGRGEAGPEGG